MSWAVCKIKFPRNYTCTTYIYKTGLKLAKFDAHEPAEKLKFVK